MKVILTCKECGVAFSRYPSQVREGADAFCSLACVGKSKRCGSLVTCARCGGQFYRKLSEQDVGRRNLQFCSMRCRRLYRAAHRKQTTYLKDGRRHAHRVIAEQIIGRPLREAEVVHHIDGNQHNNCPGNLAVFLGQSEHARCHQGNMPDEELRRYHLQ